MININILSERKIGDTLCCMPFIFEIYKLKKEKIKIHGEYSRLVVGLFDNIDIEFCNDIIDSPDYTINVRAAFDYANINDVHISSAHSIINGFPALKLPYKLPFVEKSTEFFYDLIICPFTASDENNSKFWPIENWNKIIEYIQKNYTINTIGIVGENEDEFSVFTGENIYFEKNLSL